LTRAPTPPAIKAQYKTLVKRFHPDAHGGDRSFEERLRDIIRRTTPSRPPALLRLGVGP
jgi:DnaJ-class molecular chaperone